jgi:hypothetical protein
MTPPQIRPFALPLRPGVLVVSHERSGTHFLMNALASVYHYTAAVDVESDKLPANYYFPPMLAHVVAGRAASQPNLLFKSHHAAEFFDGVLDELLGAVVILYIHRHPVDVMVSFWRLIHGFRWREGPKTATALDFAAAEPEGQLLRYQMRQRRNMLDRWARHVEGWVSAAAGRSRLVVIRYDDLCHDYETTLRGLARVLGAPSGSFQRPPRDRHVVVGAAPESLPEPDREALHALALTEVGDTMRAFGYV